MDATSCIRRAQEFFEKKENVNHVNLLTLLTQIGLTELSELSKLTKLTTKEYILYTILSEDKTANEIIQVLEPYGIKESTIKNTLKYPERETGLVYDGFVSFNEFSKKYHLLPKGSDHFVNFLKVNMLTLIEQHKQNLVELEKAEFETKVSSFVKDIIDVRTIGKKYVRIDFKILCTRDPILAEELLDNPDETLKSFQCALEQFDIPYKNIAIRIYNLPDTEKITLGNIRSEHIGKLKKIRGSVVEFSEVRPQAVSARFECPSCGNIITVLQVDTKFKEPTRCGCGRKGKFRQVSKELVDAQIIVLEELPEELGRRTQPASMNVFLQRDLTLPDMQPIYQETKPIIINGIVRETPLYERGTNKLTKFDLSIEAVSIEAETKECEILTEQDKKAILRFRENPDYMNKLIESHAPHIEGMNCIKEATLISIASGNLNNQSKKRDDVHTLIVGDPGIGKSQILNDCCEISFPSKIVLGKTTSSVGLTGGVDKDLLLNRKTIKKGALATCHGGILCADELDKMSDEDKKGLYEPLEQQTVTICKFNMHRQFRADCTLIATCNPKGGKFTTDKTKIEQIDIPENLLSRFDLKFCLIDSADTDHDKKVFNKIADDFRQEIEPPLDKSFLAKYLYYAKNYINPRLEREAIAELEKFYLQNRNGNTSLITPRQAEGLIRVARAYAKLALSDKVTKEHARKSIDLYETSLKSFDITSIMQIESEGWTSRKREEAYLELLKSQETWDTEELRSQLQWETKPFDEITDKLKRAGDIFCPKPGKVAAL